MAVESYVKVLFYVPNILGFFRVGMTLYSFSIAFEHWESFVIFYGFSFICDFFDGYLARLFNQCSSFGAVLDMVTDRCSTAGLLLILSHLYPSKLFHFLGLLLLDYASHWIHMYTARGSHKSVDENRNFILRFYYNCYPFFGFCCVGTEFFYIFLYVLSFQPDLIVFHGLQLSSICYFICLPACVLKNIVNVAQMCSSAAAIAAMDVQSQSAKSI